MVGQFPPDPQVIEKEKIMRVTVVGAPGYEDHFPATLRAMVPKVDGSEMMSILESDNGDWHTIPSRFVHGQEI